MTYCILHA